MARPKSKVITVRVVGPLEPCVSAATGDCPETAT